MIILYGALSLAAQVILLREFLLLARGQEIYLGLGLWSWLAWTGLGSLWGGRLGQRLAVSPQLLAQLLTVLAAALPITVLASRAVPAVWHFPLGVAAPGGRLALWYLLLSAPFCLLSGLFFPLACRWLQQAAPSPGLVGQAYGWEALGMGLGGLLLQLLLWGRWDSLWLSWGWCLGSLLFLVGYFLSRRRPCRLWLLAAAAAVALATLLAWYFHLPAVSRSWQWPRRQVLAVAETPLNLWTVTQEAEQISFAGNGLWFFTYPDPQTAEEQVHLALLQHPQPREVLLLGGGVAGLAAEILRTPSLQRLDYVELDPALIVLARRHLPAAAWEPLHDPRLKLVIGDARRFLRQGQSRYDVIIMALPEPGNALLNRFYTREFFAAVRDRLKPAGVFSFGLTGSETSLSPSRRSFLGLTAATLQAVFPEVLVYPGVVWRFFASPQTGVLTGEVDVLLGRREERRLPLLYVREYFLRDRLSPARLAMAQQMVAGPHPRVNTDSHPWGLYYGLLLTGLEADSRLPAVLLWLADRGRGFLFGGAALLTLALCPWSWQQRHRGGHLAPLYSVFAMGVAVMSLEMVILILYQTTLGYLYGQMSLLLAAFMLGLGGGAFLASRGMARGLAAWGLGQAGQAGLLLLLAGLGGTLPRLLAAPLLRTEIWGQLWFGALLLLGGLLGGGIFAAQAELSGQRGASPALSAGRLYAIDLLGATAGTLGVGFLVLPCFGPATALLLAAALQASALVIGVLGRRPTGRGPRAQEDSG